MYTSEYVLAMLWARIASRTQKAVAAEMGVSASHLNDVMHGRRAPTGAVLDWLGLERGVAGQLSGLAAAPLSAEGQMANAAQESEKPRAVMVELSGRAAYVLRCLFFHGPTWDGDVPSKSGRDELVNMGFAARGHGWQWLTRAGIDACLANGIDHEKTHREGRERGKR